ncbi:MAG: alpha/beta hydrolase [Hyphomicrobiales bacterium]
MSDYVERYFEAMRDLITRGYCVASFDWRGQGASQRLLKDRLRGWINSFKSYDEDLRAADSWSGPLSGSLTMRSPIPLAATSCSAPSCAKHLVLQGHCHGPASMELNMAPGRVGWRDYFTAVMVRTVFWVTLPTIRRQPIMLGPFVENPLTNSEARWDRDAGTLARYPDIAVGGATFGWLHAAMESINSLKHGSFPKGPKCPVLMVLAGRDRVVDNAAAEAFAARVPGVSVVRVQDSLHEILMERDVIREEFLAGLETYLGEAPASS